MAVLRCKMCGGTLEIINNESVAVCEYCCTRQTLPLFTEESEVLLYESGNNYLLQGEYDKAENVFNQLLTIKPNAAELYWDLVLCKYGVTYVEDPKTRKYIPTCNRTHYTPIFSDANFKKAIELSSGEKKAFFEEDAKTIDDIQKGIIAVSKKEKPFDIFISYKETDANGNRSKDSIEAQKLYEKLTEAGYKVFFSRITLEDKVGTEYEPYIYAALYSSKVMITVCSSRENIEAVWVRNEWSRYLSLQQNDAEKTIIPLYFGMDKSELPDEFLMIPSFDMKNDGFEAELLRGIKKQIPLPIMLAQKRKARKKTLTISLVSLLSVVVVCLAIILPIVIKNNITANKYEEAMVLFEEQNYNEAKAIFSTIADYENSQYMMKRCDVQPDYDKAMQLYYDGYYAQSAWAFKELGDYEDAPDMVKKAEASWRKSLSTVYTSNYYVGGYYITENGTVQTANSQSGNAHDSIEIKKNGKVYSIISNSEYAGYSENLTTLHENGVVTHPQMDGVLSKNKEWHDIIKVSDSLQFMGIVGLRSDGKLVVLSEGANGFDALNEVSNWSNIVDFKHNFEAGNGWNVGVLVGLKADGTLCAIRIPGMDETPEDYKVYYSEAELSSILSKFKNVERFSINEGSSRELEIVALTKDKKLLTYLNGEFTESDGEDICDIVRNDIVLMYNGDLVELSSQKILARDIVYAGENENGCYAVTRNGNIVTVGYDYFSGQAVVNQTGNKTIVCDEWILRLD